MNAIIIGGGASGIACAIKIKQCNKGIDVTVLEHLDCALKKIHATGNGRCNLTNFNATNYDMTSELFASLGMMTRQDSEGRVYPYSNQASTVVNILLSACDKLGIKITTECNTRSIEHIDSQYNVYTNKGTFTSDILVLATGGKSQSSLGSDGSGYPLARQLGHSISELSPALVALKSSSKHCRALKGLRTKCKLAIEINGDTIQEEMGELLFTDYGISGIVTMNLSNCIDDTAIKNGKQKAIAIIDFVPEITAQDLRAHYDEFGTFEGILPQRLCSILAKQADNDTDKIIRCIKSWRIIITGTKGYDFSQVTRGGVNTNELKDTNESAIHDGLYIIGELKDEQYECGGFNLDHAFSSGIIAGSNIANNG